MAWHQASMFLTHTCVTKLRCVGENVPYGDSYDSTESAFSTTKKNKAEPTRLDILWDILQRLDYNGAHEVAQIVFTHYIVPVMLGGFDFGSSENIPYQRLLCITDFFHSQFVCLMKHYRVLWIIAHSGDAIHVHSGKIDIDSDSDSDKVYST